MSLPIKSVIYTSLIDFDGYISTVIFLGGCNFRCGYCHNKQLVLKPELIDNIDENIVIEKIIKQIKFTKALVISGGEPCYHGMRLIKFIKKIKNLIPKLIIKLDTNGSFPYILQKILDDNLVDYIAMDIKTSFDKYIKLTNCKNSDIKKIQKSIKLLKHSNIKYEFRTTKIPKIVDIEEIHNIKNIIKKHNCNYKINNFRPENCIDDKYLKI